MAGEPPEPRADCPQERGMAMSPNIHCCTERRKNGRNHSNRAFNEANRQDISRRSLREPTRSRREWTPIGHDLDDWFKAETDLLHPVM